MSEHNDALPQRSNARRRRREEATDKDGAPDTGPASADPGNTEVLVTDTAFGTKGFGVTSLSCQEPARGAAEVVGQRRAQQQLSEGGAAAEAAEQGQGPTGEGGAGGDEAAAYPYRSAAVGTYQFEYLDHTADVQLHAWGPHLAAAFEQCALALFNYMSPLDHVQEKEKRSYRAEGHDLPSLLFAFLDELLFVFSTELFLCARVAITAFDREAFIIEAEGWGETFDRSRHEVGTEVKAITYSAMSIRETEGDAEVFVIVDICMPVPVTLANGWRVQLRSSRVSKRTVVSILSVWHQYVQAVQLQSDQVLFVDNKVDGRTSVHR